MAQDSCGFTIIEGFREPASTEPARPSTHNRESRQTSSDNAWPGQSQNVRGDLALALVAAEERLGALLEDRSRLGRELHQRILGSLNAVSLTLRANPTRGSKATEGTARAGDSVTKQIDRVVRDLRQLILRLESGALHRFSLTSELRRLVAAYTSISPLAVTLDIRPNALACLTQEEAHELLTVAREALSNCVRHAEASRATIALHSRRTRIAFTVCDDGKGFSPTDRQRTGYGLTDMASRVEKLGWQLSISSQIGRGTRITAEYAPGPVLSAV